jgi:hypothetical protein
LGNRGYFENWHAIHNNKLRGTCSRVYGQAGRRDLGTAYKNLNIKWNQNRTDNALDVTRLSHTYTTGAINGCATVSKEVAEPCECKQQQQLTSNLIKKLTAMPLWLQHGERVQ